jgi:short-subunit dehydrogenase
MSPTRPRCKPPPPISSRTMACRTSSSPTPGFPSARWQTKPTTFQTNVMGMAQTLQPFIGAMKARGSGRLVGIASVAGIRGLPGAGAYSASKAAAITFLESLRVELRGSGVKVVTIAPGYIATPMTAVNSYPMPFILPADKAARRFSRAIERGTSYTVIPWQMGVVARLMRLLPNPLFDAIFARGGRKPRGLDL